MAECAEWRRFLAGEAEAGQRLDVALAGLAGRTRSQVRHWIDEGRVRVNGAAAAASRRVEAGDAIEALPDEAPPPPLTPEPIPLHILYEDAHIVVVDKAADMVVHPSPGHPRGTLVNALLHRCGTLAAEGGELRPGIVHRLDRGTSGVLVVARDDASYRALARQFRDHTPLRIYQALVRGVPGEDTGRVDLPIGRHPRDRKRMSVRRSGGREAHTAWRVLRRFPASERSWLEVRPETGRTHQIRVHLAAAGLPLAGDPVYGRRGRARPEPGLDRAALHARVLGFRHPRTGEALRFEAPLPEDLAERLRALERREAGA